MAATGDGTQGRWSASSSVSGVQQILDAQDAESRCQPNLAPDRQERRPGAATVTTERPRPVNMAMVDNTAMLSVVLTASCSIQRSVIRRALPRCEGIHTRSPVTRRH